MSGRSWAAAAVVLLALGGCGDSDDDSPSAIPTQASELSVATLDGTAHVSTSVTGRSLVGGTKLRLDFDDGRLAVRAGCNTLSAAYSVDDGILSWTGVPASTMVGCPPALIAQDAWVSELFTGGVELGVDEHGLTLTDDDVTITMRQDPPPG